MDSDVVSNIGVKLEHRTYDSFGNVKTVVDGSGITVDARNMLTTYAYTGQRYEARTFLYDYHARWYDPRNGRFISEDPSGFDGGQDMNLYRYVGNNPLTNTDPTGLRGNTAFAPLSIGPITSPTATSGYSNLNSAVYSAVSTTSRTSYSPSSAATDDIPYVTLRYGGGTTNVTSNEINGSYPAYLAEQAKIEQQRAATVKQALDTYNKSWWSGDTVNNIITVPIRAGEAAIPSGASYRTVDYADGVSAGELSNARSHNLSQSMNSSFVTPDYVLPQAYAPLGARSSSGMLMAEGLTVVAPAALAANAARATTPVIAAPRGAAGISRTATIGERVEGVAQRAFDYAVDNPRVSELSRMQLGKDAEVQATRWLRRWAERNDVPLGPGGLRFQVRDAHSVPDVGPVGKPFHGPMNVFITPDERIHHASTRAHG